MINLEEIFAVAVEAWERVFRVGGGSWQPTIEFQWSSTMNPDLHAQAQFLSQGGNDPVRITASRVSFNNEAEFDWFADPTPRDGNEWRQF
jgi:hypothetical protein